MKKVLILMSVLLLLGLAGTASATLITNGDFSNGFTGWQSLVGNNTIVGGEAHVGRQGPNDFSSIQQNFDIPIGTGLVQVSFDYNFTGFDNEPDASDPFVAELFWHDGDSWQYVTLLNQLSEDTLGGPNFSIADSFNAVIPIAPATIDSFIIFSVDEKSDNIGTRAEIDNVVVAAVPEPATMLLLGTGLIGLAGLRKRFKK